MKPSEGTRTMERATVIESDNGLFVFTLRDGEPALRWIVPADVLSRFAVGETRPACASSRPAPAENVRAMRIRSPEQLRAALDRQKTLRHLRLGDALVQDGLITLEQHDEALALQRSECHKPLGRILVEAGFVDAETLQRVLVEKLGVPRVDLRAFAAAPDALAALPADVARKHRALPLHRSAVRIAIAVRDPMDWAALGELARATGLKVDPVLASGEEIDAALHRHYPARRGTLVEPLCGAPVWQRAEAAL